MLCNSAKQLKLWACILTSGIVLSLQSVTVFAQQPSPDAADDAYARSIVEKADQVRFPSVSLTYIATLAEPGGSTLK